MLDDILELILEIVLDGVIEAAGNEKVPKKIRIILAAVTFPFVFGICGLLIYVGIRTEEFLLIIIGTVLLMGFMIMVAQKYRARELL